MNDLKLQGHEPALRSAKKHSAAGYLELAGVLSPCYKSSRECVLTAFSLNPTAGGLHKIEQLAKKSDMMKNENDAPPLDIQDLLDDLNIIVKAPRKRFLNWQLEWPDLKKHCEEHLTRGDQPAVKELKYLELDYTQFKNMAPEEENGIEKGYEIPEVRKKPQRKRKAGQKKNEANTTTTSGVIISDTTAIITTTTSAITTTT